MRVNRDNTGHPADLTDGSGMKVPAGRSGEGTGSSARRDGNGGETKAPRSSGADDLDATAGNRDMKGTTDALGG